MKNTALEKPIYIITEYYKNNLNPYFEQTLLAQPPSSKCNVGRG